MATSSNGAVFNEHSFEKKLLNLKDTQESIQGLSTWCLHHKIHYKQIIQCWLAVLRKSKVDQCLTLFYLANDIIQHSKKKGFQEIVSFWEPALKEATPLIRDQKIKHRVERIFKIWEERDVYSSSFITELHLLLEKTTKVEKTQPTVKAVSDFEPVNLIDKILRCKTLEEETDIKQRQLNESQVKITDIDILRASLKERRKTDDFFQEFDTSVARMEEYVRALEQETQDRIKLISLLEQGDVFYEAQRGEVKVVCTAYKQFGSRVKGVKRKLEEITPQLPIRSGRRTSPIPTPDVNAPSPSSSTGSDLELPDAFASASSSEVGHSNRLTFSSAMDLDARITSFLAAGAQACSFLTAGRESISVRSTSPAPTTVPESTPNAVVAAMPHRPDPYSAYYPPVNSPFGNLSSLLAAPPPPPPPPPPPSVLLPPPMFNDLPKPEPPPMPPMSLMGHESWSGSQGHHHPLPSRIPSWSEEPINNGGSDQTEGLHPIQLANYYPAQDVDLRVNKRPIDHRNLISLTDGPGEKYTPTKTSTTSAATGTTAASSTESRKKNNISAREEEKSWLKDVLKAQEESRGLQRQHSTGHVDLNDQVNNLLDSFDPDRQDLGGGLLPLPIHRLGEEDRSPARTGSTHGKAGNDSFSPRLPYGHNSPRPPTTGTPSAASSASPVAIRGVRPLHPHHHHPQSSPTRFSRPSHPSSFGPRW